jgi:WD40 repeat protein
MDDGKNGNKRARGLDDEAIETTSASKRQCVTLKTTTGEAYKISLEVLQQHGEGSECIKTMLYALLKERKDSIEFPGHPLIPLLLSGNLGEFKSQLLNLLEKKKVFCKVLLVDVLKIKSSLANEQFIINHETGKQKLKNYFKLTGRSMNEIVPLADRILSNAPWFKVFGFHYMFVYSVAFSPDGKHIVSGSWDKTVRIWNAKAGNLEAELKGHTGYVNSVAFSPDGKHIVSGSEDHSVRVWNIDIDKKQELVIRGHTWGVKSVAFSPDGKHIVSGGRDKTVRVWEANSGWDAISGQQKLKLTGHESSIESVAFSPDGKRIVGGSADKTVCIWNAKSGDLEVKLKAHIFGVNSVAFSPDGKRIVGGSRDQTVCVWNAESGDLEAELKGHTLGVRSVAFSPDGKRIVSGSVDKTVCVWNFEKSGKPVLVLQGHTDTVMSVSYSPDGKHIVSGSHDGFVRVWHVDPSVM